MSDLSPKNILVFCFDSLGAAYQAIQLADADIDVLEVFPLGSQGHVIFGSEKPLAAVHEKIMSVQKNQIVHAVRIDNCPAKVLRAYLSVENAELETHVLIVEASYVGELMSPAVEAVEIGLKVMDLRMLRGASSSAYMFLTGDESLLLELAERSNFKTTLIKHANKHIRDLFNI